MYRAYIKILKKEEDIQRELKPIQVGIFNRGLQGESVPRDNREPRIKDFFLGGGIGNV
jgi:hypothetical protein